MERFEWMRMQLRRDVYAIIPALPQYIAHAFGRDGEVIDGSFLQRNEDGSYHGGTASTLGEPQDDRFARTGTKALEVINGLKNLGVADEYQRIHLVESSHA